MPHRFSFYSIFHFVATSLLKLTLSQHVWDVLRIMRSLHIKISKTTEQTQCADKDCDRVETSRTRELSKTQVLETQTFSKDFILSTRGNQWQWLSSSDLSELKFKSYWRLHGYYCFTEHYIIVLVAEINTLEASNYIYNQVSSPCESKLKPIKVLLVLEDQKTQSKNFPTNSLICIFSLFWHFLLKTRWSLMQWSNRAKYQEVASCETCYDFC